MSAKHLGIRAVIVMPKTTPDIKVRSVRERGGRVVLHGDSFDEALEHARMLEERDGLTFVHPYDDPDVIAGQGTIALEIMQQHSGKVDAILDRKSTRLNSSHVAISYAVFCLKKKTI